MAELGQAASVRFENVEKSFGNVKVLIDFDLVVEPGEFVVLLGASGSGKTTALRILSGLEEPSAGQVYIGDHNVTDVLPKYRDISMVFQSYALYPHKTVAENIAFPLKVRGVDKAERDTATKDAAEQVQLENLLNRYPRELSGGQRQRVALARAIIRRPSVFLMDEPLSNLDAKLRGHMRAQLKHMQHELGVTTIYVTHDQIEAMTLADRVAILEKGILQQLASPAEIYGNPANLFVAGFMGSPPMNFVECEVSDGRVRAHGIDIPVAGIANHKAVTLGFRPEDAVVVEPGAGRFDAKVYTAELTGDQTLVTVRLGEATMAIKMPKDYEADYDITVGVQFSAEQGFLFDTKSGARLDAEIAKAA